MIMPTDPEEDLRRLTPTQCKVLYWVCRGLQYWQIGNKLGYETRTIQYHMSNVYVKLGLDRLDREARRARLFQIYCPILLEQIEDPQRDCQKFQVPEKEPVEPEERALVLVEQDEREGIIPYPQPSWEPYQEGERPSRWRGLLPGCVLGGLAAMVGVAAVFLVLSRMPQGLPFLGFGTPTGPVATPTVPPPVETPSLEAAAVAEVSPTPTELPSPTATPFPTPTSTPTPAPTETPAPTVTPTLEATPSVYQVGEKAYLAPEVFLILTDELEDSTMCTTPGFRLYFGVDNQSSRQFIIRFDRETGFAIQDDEGKTYEYGGASVSFYTCKSGMENVIVDAGRYKRLYVHFRGPIPASPRYLLITIDDISGQGPFVFRKDL